jgi:hypothetical protein
VEREEFSTVLQENLKVQCSHSRTQNSTARL